ncbi:MAG: restriction endonuclease subunit S [Proteobacteria bacterium]|nr:restriction endonuclease subunit S [Pseudomonadota bacterium]
MSRGAVIREGYKKAELGWIPEDWEVKRFDEVFSFLKVEPLSREALTDKDNDLGIYNIHYGDLHATYKSELLDFDKEKRVPRIKDSVILSNNLNFLEEGDLVIADVSEDYLGIGTCIELKNVKERKILGGLHTFSVRDCSKKTVEGFRVYLLKSFEVLTALKRIATGVSVYGISKTNLSKIKIPLPPLAEQKKIAEILSTWDEAIEKLNSYIEAKKKLKKALMQRLLTGKQRFKEFIIRDGYKKTELGWIPEDWEVKRLGELVDCQSGGTPSRGLDELWNGSIPWMKIEDMTKANKYLFKTSENITEEGLKTSSARLFLGGTVFLAMYASVGKVCISKIPVTCNQAILGFYKSSNLDVEYLYYYLLFIEKLWQRNIQTGSQPNLNKNIIIGQKIFYPPLAEQKKIAEILSKADEEIDLLNQELEKLKIQKKGLMQKLLTGVWRVKL